MSIRNGKIPFSIYVGFGVTKKSVEGKEMQTGS